MLRPLRIPLMIALVSLAVMPATSQGLLVIDYPITCTGAIDSFLDGAILEASPTALIRVFISAGTCSLQNTHTINGAVSFSIIGAGTGSTVIEVGNLGSYALLAGSGTGGVNLDVESMTLQAAATHGVIGIVNNSLLRIDHVRFLNNAGSFGGAIGATTANVTIRNSSFEGGSASLGGAISIEGGSAYSLSVVDSVFSGNSSSGNGGAIDSSVQVTLNRVLFSGNHADSGNGGAIYALQSDLDVRNSTFTANSAASGGAIDAERYGGAITVGLNNVTLHGDSASASGSEIFFNDPMPPAISISILNSLVGGTCAGFSLAPDAHGSIESPGSTCGLTGASNQVNVADSSLMLGSLANNGGATKTLYPNAGSVLIGAGSTDCEGVDQRDLVRNAGACDVGAVEAGATLADEIFGDNFGDSIGVF